MLLRHHTTRFTRLALAGSTLLVALLSLAACGQSRTKPAPPTADVTVAPAAASHVTAVATPAVLTVTSPENRTGMPWWNDRVFYEIFVRSFGDSDGDGVGDLDGLIEKLDYLNDGDPATADDLGVTGIWLMPIMQSPSYHGYDTTDYYTVDQEYGTNDDFKRLVDEAHTRGISVLVDLVLNHTSSEHPWFLESAADPTSDKRDWYRWSTQDDGSRTPWRGGPVWHKRGDEYYFGLFWEGMPDLNYDNPEVTQEMENVARFWLEEMGADGFRLDAIRHLVEEGQTYASAPATHAWLQRFDDFVDGVDPQALTVGEVWDTTAAVAPYVVDDEVDLAFEFDLASRILESVRSGKPLGSSQELSRMMALFPPGQFATFLTNHDQNRVATHLVKDPAGNKLAATVLMTLPGVPFIYYGEEIGMTGAKPDEWIRTPMQWTGDPATGGFTTGIPWEPLNADVKKVNVAAQEADPTSLLSHYRQLIRLRNEHAALRQGDFVPVDSSCPSTFAFMRHLPAAGPDLPAGQTVLVVVNFAKKGKQAGCTFSYDGGILPAGAYQARDLLTGAAVAPLDVEAGGFQSYAPVPTLPHQAGFVLLLEESGE